MALSKLAIGLIAGMGSVAAIGGITAGIVVSRQNATQTTETDNSSSNENRRRNDANNSFVSTQPKDPFKDEESNLKDEKMISDEAKDKNGEKEIITSNPSQSKGGEMKMGMDKTIDATQKTPEEDGRKKEQPRTEDEVEPVVNEQEQEVVTTQKGKENGAEKSGIDQEASEISSPSQASAGENSRVVK